MYRTRALLFVFIFSVVSFAQPERYELTAINFEGNSEFSSSVLADIIYSKKTPFFFWKWLNVISSSLGDEPVYFDSSYIPVDIHSLNSFYKSNGFFLSSFNYKYNIDTSSNTAQLTYLIDEGEQALVGKVNLKGIGHLSWEFKEGFINYLKLDSTKKFQQNYLINGTSRGINYLSDNGYMLASFDSSVIYKDTINNRANIDLFFTPGKRYFYGDLNITKSGGGKDDVSNKLINEVAAIKEGEIYSSDKIKRSRARLFRTGLFNSLIFDASAKDTSGSYVPVKFAGVIGSMNEIEPEIILNNQFNTFNFGLGASYTRKNFLGDARKFILTGRSAVIDAFNFNYNNLFKKPSDRDSTFQGTFEVSAALEQPFLLGKPIYSIWENYYIYALIDEIEYASLGSKLSFDIEMPAYTFITILKPYYNLEFSEAGIKNIPVEMDDYTALLNLSMESLTSSIGTELGSSKINSLFFPTNGFNLSAVIEGSISKSDLKYLLFLPGILFDDVTLPGNTIFYKLQATTANFIPLSLKNDAVLGIKTKVGHIQSVYGQSEYIPAAKTFFGGGSNSIRGWRARELRPVSPPENYNVFDDTLRGGNFLLEGSIEYRKKFFDAAGTALFLDYGNTWNSYKDIRLDNIALAVGIGFRYYTPIAPFRIDFGFKFYDPADKKFIFDKNIWSHFAFHFGIGEAF